jgi:hypothetical protein
LPANYKESEKRIKQEEVQLSAIQGKMDPIYNKEFESLREVLENWKDQQSTLDLNRTNDGVSTEKKIEEPHNEAWRVIGLNDKREGLRLSFPASKSQILKIER